MTVLNIAIHTISACVGCLSLSMLGLVSHSILLKDKLDYAAPPDLKSTGMSLLFWPACGGIIDCCLFLYLWTKAQFHGSRGKRKKDYYNALLFVASFFVLRPFIVLIYTFVEQSVEGWACLLSSHTRNGIAESLCRELRVTRYLLFPLIVLGVCFLTLVFQLKFGSEGESRVPHGDAITDAVLGDDQA